MADSSFSSIIVLMQLPESLFQYLIVPSVAELRSFPVE